MPEASEISLAPQPADRRTITEESEAPLVGMELLLAQVDRLSELIEQEFSAEAPFTVEEEEEFQGYVQRWVAEYQRLAAAGEEYAAEAKEVLDMIRTMLGDYAELPDS